METANRNEKDLKSIVFSALSEIKQKLGSGLERESPDKLRSRLLDIVRGEHNWQIHVGSDGLELDNKILIERQLLSQLGEKFPQDPFTIYFRRTQADAKGNKQAPTSPVSINTSPNPFGINVRKRPIPEVKNIIVVASGKGGVGKSTVSTNLAISLGKLGHKVGLMDADVYGPSGPTMLGTKGPMEIDEDGKLIPLIAHNVKVVSFGFLSDAYHPVIWRGPLVSKAIEQLCFDVAWKELDILVIDLPPGTGDVQLSLIESLPIEGAVIVSTPQDVALIDAHKALSMFNNLNVPVFGMVENMSVFACPNCGHEEHIFGEGGGEDFSKQRNIPILAKIPLDASIRMACDTGQPISLQKRRPQAKAFSMLAEKIALSISNHSAEH
ncbi:MAG: Mrp/NBP35 family ATP-binding protein [Oligoflexales bacterium]|nr:Mrp/NBP35 family ATP-binding protein [Oligoflexales bacterium]